MNDNRCMARKNMNNPELQCSRTVHKNTDFCRYHIRYRTYHKNIINKIFSQIIVKRINKSLDKQNIHLDKTVNHNLLGIFDSWKEVPLYRRISLDGEMFDICTITKHFTNQINSSLMENPLPIYPSNPFNKNLFTPKSLLKLKKHMDKYNIFVDESLYTFLSSDIQLYYDEACKIDNNSCNLLILEFDKKYRYKLLNCKNSQDAYIGRWIDKNVPLSQFEKIYEQYINTPFQIVDYHGYVINNPRKLYLESVLDALPEEEWII